jgi:hypothetical protein
LPVYDREKITNGRKKYFPLLTKGDEGGLDNLFERVKNVMRFLN